MRAIATRFLLLLLPALAMASGIALSLPVPVDEPFVFRRHSGDDVAASPELGSPPHRRFKISEDVTVSPKLGSTPHKRFKAWLTTNARGWTLYEQPLPRARYSIRIGEYDLLFTDSMVFASTSSATYAKPLKGGLDAMLFETTEK